MDTLLEKIRLNAPSADLFDEVAEQVARELSRANGNANKSTQLRRFYDEIERWNTKAQSSSVSDDDFKRLLPLIRMLNAKVAYAEGRKLVDSNFANLMRVTIRQVNSKQDLENMKLFLESTLGFLKLFKNS